MSRIEEIKKAIDQVLSNDYCARELDTVDSDVGKALDVVLHNADRYVEVYLTIQEKIELLKQASNYPHNFTGQMVEDLEWVLGLMN